MVDVALAGRSVHSLGPETTEQDVRTCWLGRPRTWCEDDCSREQGNACDHCGDATQLEPPCVGSLFESVGGAPTEPLRGSPYRVAPWSRNCRGGSTQNRGPVNRGRARTLMTEPRAGVTRIRKAPPRRGLPVADL